MRARCLLRGFLLTGEVLLPPGLISKFVSLSPSVQHIPESAIGVTMDELPALTATTCAVVLWNTYGECANYSLLTGHTGAILDARWSADGSKLFSASTDKTCGVWDAETVRRRRCPAAGDSPCHARLVEVHILFTCRCAALHRQGERIRKLRGHTAIINACSPARIGDPLLATVSDDRTVKIWDSRRRHHVHSFESKYQLTAVAYSQEGDQVIVGGVGCAAEVWDIRKGEMAYTLAGHTDTITGLELSPDGRNVISNAMDNKVPRAGLLVLLSFPPGRQPRSHPRQLLVSGSRSSLRITIFRRCICGMCNLLLQALGWLGRSQGHSTTLRRISSSLHGPTMGSTLAAALRTAMHTCGTLLRVVSSTLCPVTR